MQFNRNILNDISKACFLQYVDQKEMHDVNKKPVWFDTVATLLDVALQSFPVNPHQLYHTVCLKTPRDTCCLFFTPWKYAGGTRAYLPEEVSGLSTEADLMKAGLSRPLTFRYGGRTIGNVIRVLRLNQRVWMCSSIHHRRAPVSSCWRKWGSPWRPPMSYLRLITHSAFCPLRACTHK